MRKVGDIQRLIGESKETIEEGVDTKAVIKSLSDTDFKGDNKEQMKGVQLLKGLAASDDPLATKFMDKLSDAFTSVANSVSGGGDKGDDKGGGEKKEFPPKKE